MKIADSSDSGVRRAGRPRRRPAAWGTLAALAVVIAVVPPAGAQEPPAAPVDIQLLAINDFHGNLEPPAGTTGTVTVGSGGGTRQVPAGGAAYLATHLERARHGRRHSLTVSAGDNIGASPLLSAAYHDEPTIESLGRMGLDVSSVGNHEFDEGKAELRRMRRGGCHPVDRCADPARPFTGARFPYLAANVVDSDTKKPIFPPYWVKSYSADTKIGFIGMTLRDTPEVSSPKAVKGLDFLDEARTAEKYVPELRKQGVRAIVLLLHQGGKAASPVYDYDCDANGPGAGLSGPLVDVAKRIHPEIDLIVAGHTNQSHVCTILDPGGRRRLVTSTSSFSKMYTDITLPYDPRTRDVLRDRMSARNAIVTRDVPPDPDQTALIGRWRRLVDPVAARVVGHIGADLPGRGSPAPETPLGRVVADAQLAATGGEDRGRARIALVSPGDIRSDLVHRASGGEGDGVVTYAETFAVQPFGGSLVTMSLTGAQLVSLLRQQYPAAGAEKVLQVSEGFTFTVDTTRTGGDRIVASSVKLDGRPIAPDRTYRVTVNDFLADGGDGFTVLTKGTDRRTGVTDIEALTGHLGRNSAPGRPLPPTAPRIRFVPEPPRPST